jgi:negative regulator of genetic competence, sporulation and motility
MDESAVERLNRNLSKSVNIIKEYEIETSKSFNDINDVVSFYINKIPQDIRVLEKLNILRSVYYVPIRIDIIGLAKNIKDDKTLSYLIKYAILFDSDIMRLRYIKETLPSSYIETLNTFNYYGL